MKGVDVVVKIGTAILAAQRNATLNRSAETLDSTTKDSNGWKENEAGYREWSISTDGLLVESDAAYTSLEDAYMAGEKVTVEFTTGSGNRYHGEALITDFPIQAPYTDNVTYNVTFQGSGALTKSATVQVVNYEEVSSN